MDKICRFCKKIITLENISRKNGYIRNECKPCRVKENLKYKRLKTKDKEVPCEYCNILCIKKFFRAFCSDKCRFLGFIKKEDDCWLWQGRIGKDGYGTLMIKSIETRAHRFSYELFIKKIDKGMLVLHSCHNTSCVNPDHLREGTVKENTQDMVEAKRHLFGEKGTASKLKEHQVREILLLYSQSYSQQYLAHKYNVSQKSISNIIRRKTWSHIGGPF